MLILRIVAYVILGMLLAERGVYAREHWQFWAIMACALAIGYAG